MTSLEADYLVIGAGAVSMAFVDTMLDESDATFIMVDRHAAPGGHWNDAYPFVRLHQPSMTYGVASTRLGTDRIDAAGPNKGYFELASGAETLAYFDQIMRERFLPSGRVQYFPMHDYLGDGAFRALLSGAEQKAKIRKRVVDGTYYNTSVPSTHERKFAVAEGAACIPPNDLPRRAAQYQHFAILGGGKTAMDAATWLIGHGADPDAITWVVPRDSWLLNREKIQPGPDFRENTIGSVAEQLAVMKDATSIDDLFLGLERVDAMLRIDPSVTPTMVHYATISPGERDVLRRIKNVVRGERVSEVRPGEMVFMSGAAHPVPDDTLFIDCTATAVQFKGAATRPMFEDGLITLQALRAPLVTFSAAVAAYVEANFDSDEEKNRLCTPIELTDDAAGYAGAYAANMMNQKAWMETPGLREWLADCRLNPAAARGIKGAASEKLQASLAQIGETAPAAVMNLFRIVAEHRAANVTAA